MISKQLFNDLFIGLFQCRIDFGTYFCLLTLINTKVCSVRIANPDRTDNFIYHDPNRIKYKDPEAHKSELLKCPEITHE